MLKSKQLVLIVWNISDYTGFLYWIGESQHENIFIAPLYTDNVTAVFVGGYSTIQKNTLTMFKNTVYQILIAEKMTVVSHLKDFRGGDEEAEGRWQAGCEDTSGDEVVITWNLTQYLVEIVNTENEYLHYFI